MLELLYLKDAIEILFLSSIVHYFCLWLKKDKQHNLLLYFYAYCIIFLLSFLLQFPTITSFLFYASPFVLVLFLLFHQEVLQRNFISMYKSTSLETTSHADWVDHLMRAALATINNNQQLLCIIENNFDISPFLKPEIICNSPISNMLLSLIVNSPLFDHQKMIWCKTDCKLIALNVHWQEFHQEVHHSQKLSQWHQEALLVTLKTDTVLFKADPAHRSFDVISKGTVHEKLSAAQALFLMKKYLTASWQGDTHYAHDQKSVFRQQSH